MAERTARSFVWLARHGIKEPESGDCNWDLALTEEGVLGVARNAKLLSAEPPERRPFRIACSPFPRCIATAGLYAVALGIDIVHVEPGLCEVLAPQLGAKGLSGHAPRWTAAELEGLLIP